MSFDINVITQISNKTLSVVDMDNVLITSNVSNEIITVPYGTSYIIYVEPTIKDIGFTGFLDLSNSILSGFFGYIWIFILVFIFYYLIKGVKNNVK